MHFNEGKIGRRMIVVHIPAYSGSSSGMFLKIFLHLLPVATQIVTHNIFQSNV
jgi:hypothetical protein